MVNPRARRHLALATALVIVAVAWLGSRQLHAVAASKRKLWPKVAKVVHLPSPKLAPVSFLGYRQFAADIMWVRALIYYSGGAFEAGDYTYFARFLDNIMALDPRFYRFYDFASLAITHREGTASEEEIHMSLRYLEAGLEQFPDAFELLSRAGGRYYFDLYGFAKTDEQGKAYRKKALDYYNRAMRSPGAPPGYATFVASIHTKLGQRERALQTLREMYLNTQDEKDRAKILQRYRLMMKDDKYADALEDARLEFDRQHKQHLPFAQPGMFVLLGPSPSKAIDFDALATESDLAGTADPVPFGVSPAAPSTSAPAPGPKPSTAP